MTVAGVLGCGQYDAYVQPRGGGSVFAAVDWTELSWQRVLDDTSESAVTIDDACIGSLGDTRPWRHELALYRDGALVWVGPVVAPSAPVDPDRFAYALTARGISAWWDHRLIHNDHDYAIPTDLAEIFQAISDDAMSVDDSAGLVLSTTPCGVLGVLQILSSQHVLAGGQLRDLAKIGVDWTEVGREVRAGGTVVPAVSLGTMLDEHFTQSPTPILDGLQQANVWVVRGQGGGASGDAIYASAANDAVGRLDGVLESVDTVSTIQDYDSARAAADSRVALTTTLVTLQEGFLAPDAPFEIGDLVPGALCDLNLTETQIPVVGQYRLQRLNVQAGADGRERVGVSFQPVGAS